MNAAVLKQYLDANFSETPTAEFTWKYQMRDTLDEWAYGLAAASIFWIVQHFGQGFWDWLAYVGWGVCVLYAVYLIWIIFLRRMCVSYTLTPDHFIFKHGFFMQKTETFQLSDIIQVSLRRTIWERIIRTGTVKIRFKTSAGISSNPLTIRGIGKFNEMFEHIDYYRNHHRLVLYLGI